MCASARLPSRKSATTIRRPVANTCSGILRLVSNRVARERHATPHPRQLQLELAALAGQHHKAAFGARHVNRRVHHEREHLVENAVAAQAAQRVEQRGNLPEPADDPEAPALRAGIAGPVVDQEHELRARGATDLDLVAVREMALRHLRAVDVRPAARAAVAHQVAVRRPAEFRRDRARRRCRSAGGHSRSGGRW